MKIVMFAFIMVVTLTLVDGWWINRISTRRHGATYTVNGMRLKRDLNNKLVQLDLGNGHRRYIRDVNKKHHVHMSNERVPAVRVARNAQTLKNVHERMFAVTEDAGK
jgi:uncharacterized protein YqfA (UPF0365 family)